MITYNNEIKAPVTGSLVRDLLDANTPSNSRTALDSLATTLNEPVKPFSPASANKMRVIEQPVYDTGSEEQVGMFGKDLQAPPTTVPFSAGWSEGFVADDKTLANMDRIGGLSAVKNATQEAQEVAKNYKLENGLSFDMFEQIQDEGTAQQKADELNAFTNSPGYLTGLNNYMAEMEGSDLTTEQLQMYYADANGIRGRTSTLLYDEDKQEFTYKMPDTNYIKAAVETGLTLAVGAALAPVFATAGLGQTAAASVGKAVASGAATAIKGGDLGDVAGAAIFAGATQYASSISEAATAAEAANVAQGANVTADAISSAAVLADKATLASNVSNALKVVKAVENKDILSGVTSALALGGLDSPLTFAKETIEESFGDIEWVSQNSDALASASIKFTDKVTQGSSIEESLLSSAIEYAKEGGGLSQLIPEGLDTGDFELDNEFINTILEAGKVIDKEYVQPAKDTVVEIAQETGRFIADNVPDAPDLDLSGLKQTLSDFNKDEIKPIIASVKDFIGDIDLPNIGLPDLSSLLAGGSSGSGSRGTGSSKADLVNIMLTDPELVKGIEYADLSNYLTKERTI